MQFVRDNALFVAGVVAILALVVVAYFAILGGEEETPQPKLVEQAPQAKLAKVGGPVELRVGSGEWTKVMPGQVVNPGDGLRTGVGGLAELVYGDTLSAELQAESSIRLERLDDEVARFVVGKGLVIVDAKELGAGPGRWAR